MLNSGTIPTRAAALLFVGLGLAGTQAAFAQRGRQTTIEAGSVVRLQSAQTINSRTARQGQPFAATLSANDESGFPAGTRFQGVIRNVLRRTAGKAGTLDVELRRAVFPGGTGVPLIGRLTSLEEDDVRRTDDGRFEGRRRGNRVVEWHWAGSGDGGNTILTPIGGRRSDDRDDRGGVIEGYLERLGRNRRQTREANVVSGTEFGMRLDQRVAFNDRSSYRYRRAGRDGGPPDQRVLGDRDEQRYREAQVYFNGRAVELGERPTNVRGVLYVPLEPIARAARMPFAHRAGQERFTLETAAGPTEGYTGQTRVTRDGRQPLTLAESPLLMNGTIYVSADYLERVTSLRPNWNPAQMRLDLDDRR